MKWSKTVVLAVVVIFSVSYAYSTLKRNQLSNNIEDQKLKACSEKGGYDCDLIAQYHDACFDTSYRAEYKIRDFHRGEYNRCMDSRIKGHLSSVME